MGHYWSEVGSCIEDQGVILPLIQLLEQAVRSRLWAPDNNNNS